MVIPRLILIYTICLSAHQVISITSNEDSIKNLRSLGLSAKWNLKPCLRKYNQYNLILNCIRDKNLMGQCDWFLYTKDNKTSPTKLNLKENQPITHSIPESQFSSDKKLVVLVHGMTDKNESLPWVTDSKNALIDHHDANVIEVRWSITIDTVQVASQLGIVFLADLFGKKLSKFLSYLVKNGWNVTRIHVVGHGVGAQIAALGGKHLKLDNNIVIHRLTALDPLGMAFDQQPRLFRLSQMNAEFVDCIFTSAPIIGMRNPVCHANFYANCYGGYQPMEYSPVSSHIRAAFLFAESILPDHKFNAKKCRKVPCKGIDPKKCVSKNGSVMMGYPAHSTLRGIYYVKTNSKFPFGTTDTVEQDPNRRNKSEVKVKSIYTDPKFMRLILGTSNEMQMDLTPCLVDAGKGKLAECVATSMFFQDCDFFLYPKCTDKFKKRKCKNHTEKLASGTNLNALLFNNSKTLVVIVHRTSEKNTGSWLLKTKDYLLYNHDVNVIMMGWRSKIEYAMVTSRLGWVVLADVFGRKLATLLEKFISAGVKSQSIHLIGNGMGAQICAFAGKYLKRQNKTIGRITGLDPVGEIFDSQPKSLRVDKKDATFVDCIFTKSRETTMRDPVCRANFYPNCYGEEQPGENSILIEERAPILFAKSVTPDHTFHAKKCAHHPCHGSTGPKDCENGTALMGYPASPKLKGIFYVNTGGNYPFSTDDEKPKTEKLKRRFLRNEETLRIGGFIMDEMKLFQKMVAYGMEAGFSMSVCTAKTIFGLKKAMECIISKFMVKDCDFYIYTKKHGESPTKLRIDQLKRQAKKLHIDKNKDVVFLIHGVTVNYTTEWIRLSNNYLFAYHDVNVMVMDWRSRIDHVLMASNVGLIPLAKCFGEKLATFLLALLNAGWEITRFHLVGHSLGGQIVGFAGKTLKHSQKTLLRITALDPAGLLFDSQSTNYRLDKSDAEFVDCIFTSAPIISMRYPVCTANFYANCYGKDQPGTETNQIGGATTLSHLRAATLFAESVIPSHKFHAKKCEQLPCRDTKPEDCLAMNGTALMGYPASSKLEGIFYVKTKGTYPFSPGKNRMKRRSRIRTFAHSML